MRDVLLLHIPTANCILDDAHSYVVGTKAFEHESRGPLVYHRELDANVEVLLLNELHDVRKLCAVRHAQHAQR